LAAYSGRILSVAESSAQWEWIPQPAKLTDMAKNVAISVRNLAEGRLIQVQKSLTVWAILGYILAGLLVLMITMIVLGTVFGG
jgi:type IV secretory pathway component VirB8